MYDMIREPRTEHQFQQLESLRFENRFIHARNAALEERCAKLRRWVCVLGVSAGLAIASLAGLVAAGGLR